MIVVEEITSVARFRELDTEWNMLDASHAGDTPFLSHEWFLSCVEAYGEGKRPCILFAREKGIVVGIAPLWSWKEKVRGVPARLVGFIAGPDTPFADILVPSERRAEISCAFTRYLAEDRGRDWDLLVFSQWPKETPNQEQMLISFASVRRRYTQTLFSQSPYIAVREDWEDFLKGRSARFRKTHRNINNRVEKLRNVEVLRIREDPSGDHLRDILAVSMKGWKHGEGKAITNREDTVRFFQALTVRAGKRGCLFAWLLKFDGVPVAMEYDLEHAGIVYALRSDFDEAYKEYSPGSYLEYHIVKFLFENGFTEYHSGPGMNVYKMHWTEAFKENVSVHVFNDNMKGTLLAFLETRLIPFLKRLRDLRGTTT